MLRFGAMAAGGVILSASASSQTAPGLIAAPTADPLAPFPPRPAPAVAAAPSAPGGINPHLFARAKAALDSHRIAARDSIGIVDFSLPSSEPRFHVVDLRTGQVESYRVAHGSGSDPDHSGFVERFSNDFGSYASSNGTYTTGDYYHGKYGLSMKTRGLDWSNYNAEPRAIVIHNAWYAEPDVLAAHGKLGRSQGCFAFSREDQWPVMRKLAGGRMIYADKLA
ncbi:MAG TPA: murein L,D-transpeptidase catalytic domain family protein [Sphingomicrobium sp.]|nr:murein L,D-transpeptidase catalytic domain family protein [Sphingomicrobium sp.]